MDEGPENIVGEQAGEQLTPTEVLEKMWNELTDSEKIERMHEVMYHLKAQICRMQEEADRLERHEHGHSGGVLVPFGIYPMPTVGHGGDKDRWF